MHVGNLLLINSISLVVSSLEMQIKLIQTKEHRKFFCSVSKITTHKPSKVATAKNNLVHSACYRYNLLWWMFFILFDNWNSLIFVKVCRYNEILSAAILQLSSKQSALKEVRILRYLHNIIEVLISKFQNKVHFVHFTW